MQLLSFCSVAAVTFCVCVCVLCCFQASFLEFAPAYFEHMARAAAAGKPTVLAKVAGVYSISIRSQSGAPMSAGEHAVQVATASVCGKCLGQGFNPNSVLYCLDGVDVCEWVHW